MSNKLQLAESLRRMAVMFQDMVAAADAMEKIGVVEQATQEAAQQRLDAEAARDTARQELTRARQEIERINSDLAERVVAAQEQARGIVAGAESRSEEIVEAAEAKAREIVVTGQAQASDELANMANQLAAMQAKLTELTEEANAAILVKDKAEAEAREAEAKLGKVQAQIRKLTEGLA
jgi:chromosome segregation ATPase